MNPLRRILDVNFNRSREALRVLEEVARFVLADRELTDRCKAIRHQVTTCAVSVGSSVGDRDAAGDVGTSLQTEGECTRRNVRDVAAAAASRVGESLRVLEEFLKIDHAQAAAGIERCRYGAYDLARDVIGRLSRRAPHEWRICVLLTASLCGGRPWQEVAAAALDGGADVIQLREPEVTDAVLLSRAEELRELTAGRAALVINDRPDVAMLVRADGVHLGQHDLPVAAVRRLAGEEMILGVSTSGLRDAEAAWAGGADYCGTGPMFPTATKHREHIAGPKWLEEFVRWGRLPHLAIGGITAERIALLAPAGVRAVAVCGAVLNAEDPSAAVRALRAALDGAAPESPPPGREDRAVTAGAAGDA